MRRLPLLPLLPLSMALLLAACGQQAGGPGGAGGPPPGVSVAPAVQREVQATEAFVARLEAPDTVEVRARVAGTVEAVRFKEGQVVRKGEPLFNLDARAFKAEVARAEAQVLALKTQAELSRSELARAEKLIASQAVSAQEVDQLRAALRQAEAQQRAAESGLLQAKLNVEYASITAPVTGRTSRAAATVGNLVGVGEPVLTTLVSSDRVYAYFDVSERTYLQSLQKAKGAVPVSLGLETEAGHPHTGKLDFVDNRLNPNTGTIRARAVFDNREGRFTPGLSARLLLASGERAPAVLISERAITTDQTRKIVLVVGPNNIVQPREVKPGALIDGLRVVEGLKAGELVIVDGLQRANPGAPVTPQVLKTDEAGHPMPAAPAPAASK